MKSSKTGCRLPLRQSLPSRECGLKFAPVHGECLRSKSLPSRECGLKFFEVCTHGCNPTVTPFAGVWIEISKVYRALRGLSVTPFAGVWIEICSCPRRVPAEQSLPSRECGLKLGRLGGIGAGTSHSLRGSVD